MFGFRVREGSAALLVMVVVGCRGGGGTPAPASVNRFAYVAAPSGREISWYSVANATGRLRPEGVLRSTSRAARIDLVDAHRLILTDGDSRISYYTRNLTTGRARWAGEVRDVNHYAVSPNGDFVFATKPTGQGVEAYRITDAGVDATPAASFPMGSGAQLTTLFYHPSGRWVYGPRAGVLRRFGIDSSVAIPITQMSDAYTDTSGAGIEDLIFDVRGDHAAIIAGGQFLPADVASDGVLTAKRPAVAIGALASPRVHPSGQWLFALQQGEVRVWRIDPVTFVPNATHSARAGVAVGGYDWDETGERVTITSPNRTLETYRFNATTGAFTSISFQYDGWAHAAIAMSAGTSFASRFEVLAFVINKADSTIQSYKVDASGSLTSVGSVPTGGTAPSALAVNPHEPFVYVANEGSNDVAAFAIDMASGALTRVQPNAVVGSRPAAIVAEPSGGFVYVANAGDNTVSQLAVDPSTGALSLAHGPRSTGVTEPSTLAADPTGLLLYVGAATQSSPAVEAYTISETGQLMPPVATLSGSGLTPAGAPSLQVDPYGELLFSTFSGSPQSIGYCPLVGRPNCANHLQSVGFPASPRSIAVDEVHGRVFTLGSLPSGPTFCVSPYQYGTYASVGTPAPVPVQMPTTLATIFKNPVQLVSSPSGNWHYLVDQTRNRIAVFDVDAHNELTLRSSFATGNGPVAMALKIVID